MFAIGSRPASFLTRGAGRSWLLPPRPVRRSHGAQPTPTLPPIGWLGRRPLALREVGAKSESEDSDGEQQEDLIEIVYKKLG